MSTRVARDWVPSALREPFAACALLLGTHWCLCMRARAVLCPGGAPLAAGATCLPYSHSRSVMYVHSNAAGMADVAGRERGCM